MKLFITLVLIISTFLGTATCSRRAADGLIPLRITLEMIGNTTVQGTVSNPNSVPIKAVNAGTVLDKVDTRKFHVLKGNTELDFKAPSFSILIDNLIEEDFTIIPAGGSVLITQDIAKTHQLNVTGVYSIIMGGHLPIAKLDSTKAHDSIFYLSNLIETYVAAEIAMESFGQGSRTDS